MRLVKRATATKQKKRSVEDSDAVDAATKKRSTLQAVPFFRKCPLILSPTDVPKSLFLPHRESRRSLDPSRSRKRPMNLPYRCTWGPGSNWLSPKNRILVRKKQSMENGEAVDSLSPPHSFMGIDVALTR